MLLDSRDGICGVEESAQESAPKSIWPRGWHGGCQPQRARAWGQNGTLRISKHLLVGKKSDMGRGFGSAKNQYTTCHPRACSPGPEVLREMPTQLLSCEHSSSRRRTERFAVIPKRTVTKEKDWWHLSSPRSGSEPTPKAIPLLIRIRAQGGSGARFWSCPVPAALLKTGGDKFSQRLCELVLLIQRLETIPGEWQVACLNVHRRDWEEAEAAGMSPSPVQPAEAKPVHPETPLTEKSVAEYPR